MRHAPPQHRAQTSPRATVRLFACSIISALVLALAFTAASAGAQPLASAGWHGRAIQHPQHLSVVVRNASFPPGWAAGAVRLGTGLHQHGGSTRVREVQKRLWRLGFRPGPVDGIFGPRTQAAVEWFQIKHGFKPDGVVGLATLTHLRERTGAAPVTSSAHAGGGRAAATAPASQPQAAVPQPAARSQSPAGGRNGGKHASKNIVALALLLLAVPAVLALATLWRRRAPRQRRPAPDRKVARAPAPHPPRPARPRQVPTIAYLRPADRAELARYLAAVRDACTRRGWKVTDVLRDAPPGPGRPAERPGLARTLERLATPGPSRLVVCRLSDLSRSASELARLFEWFMRHDVGVIALDAGVDTTTPRGGRAAQALLASVVRHQQHAQVGDRARARRPALVAAAATSPDTREGGDPG